MNIIDYQEGIKIKEPCIIRGMPSEVYHKTPALSNSGLKTLINCPAKYYYKYLSGEYEAKEKPYFKIGKAAHKYILEGREAFEKEYWHNPYSELKKEDLIKILKDFDYDDSIKKMLVTDLMKLVLEKAGIEPKENHLTASELNQIICMARAINADKKAHNALSQKGEAELSIFWQDDKTGVWLKCRPDYLPYDCKNIPDQRSHEVRTVGAICSSMLEQQYPMIERCIAWLRISRQLRHRKVTGRCLRILLLFCAGNHSRTTHGKKNFQ